MRWNNSPIPWDEFERRLSLRPPASAQEASPSESQRAEAAAVATPSSRAEPRSDEPAVPYAELHAHSHYSFLDGSSAPEQLIAEATRLGLTGLALTDHDGFYGAARFAEAAEAQARRDREDAKGRSGDEHENGSTEDGNRDGNEDGNEHESAHGDEHRGGDGNPHRNGDQDRDGERGASLLTVYGAELSLGLDAPQLGAADPAGTHLLVLARGAQGYHRLAGAITEAQLAGGEKGRPVYDLEALAEAGGGEWVILTGCRKGAVRRALDATGGIGAAGMIGAGGPSTRGAGDAPALAELDRLTALFGADNVYVELTHHGHPGDDPRNARLAGLAAERGLPTIATGNVHYASRAQARLAEAMAAVRARRSLDELDPHLPASGGAHLRSGAAMLRRFARYPDAVARTVPLARELAFPLKAARPNLPRLELPEGHTQMSWLRRLVWEGAGRRYGASLPESHRTRLEQELAVIEKKEFPGYFLIVHDLVREARSRGILCQGRGSAANSAVCYVLGITAVDAIFYRLPFERFLSSMRDEEPDIDVDFDSEKREQIIQYVYEKYGRRNAAQVANVISYRPKAAIRDAAKALGYGPGQQRAWTKGLERWGGIEDDPDSPIPAPVQQLARQFLKAPRHLGIHSGGMVLTERPVGEVCPIEHARMDKRTVLQWDKDSCETMGLVKFDLLGLGMLSALQKTMDIVAASTGERWAFDTIPKEEPGVYDMLCRADAVGVFQVESRAQLNTLPRLRPRTFYDLVIEIALIRPGPIQGGAVHPYLRRREGEPVTYPHPLLEPVLERTLGIPIFQEQLMQMATTIGGCSAEDADLLRRSMGSKRGEERIESLEAKLFAGMKRNGITDQDAARLYEQIKSFADFGFAESHSLSFALLVYVSSWFKLHYPGAFLAGLLRSQPMGFYSSRELVQDARRHGVEVRPPDVQRSGAEAELEAIADGASTDGAPAGGASGASADRAPASGASADRAPAAGASADRAPAPRARSTGSDACIAQTQPPVGPFDPDAPDTSGAHRRDGAFAVRLGLTGIRGIELEAAERITRAREQAPFADLADLARRADLDRGRIEALAAAGACESLGIGRREALWAAVPAADNRERFLPGIAVHVQPPLLPVLNPAEQTALDLWTTGIPLAAHPLALLRESLDARGVVRSDRVRRTRPGTMVEVAGLVTHRQRPGTAGGIVFVTLEDEAGSVNVVTWRDVWLRNRLVARSSPALVIRGAVERSPEGVVNIIADAFEPLASPAGITSRDFR